MEPNRRRDREKVERRSRILAAAERAFLAQGFTETTMDTIASEAEFTKRTVYQYFRCKEDILFEVAAGLLARLNLQVHEAGDGTSARDRLQDFAARFYRAIADRPRESALMDAALALRSARRGKEQSESASSASLAILNDHLGALYASFVDAVAAGVADGSLRKDLDPVDAAFAVFFLIKSFLAFVAAGESRLTAANGRTGDELALSALALAIAGMRPGGE